jgi:hypothetical protein
MSREKTNRRKNSDEIMDEIPFRLRRIWGLTVVSSGRQDLVGVPNAPLCEDVNGVRDIERRET